MGITDDLDAYTKENLDRFVEELKDFVRIPSISVGNEHEADVLRAAEHLQAAMRGAGFTTTEILPTSDNPAVYGERIVDPSLPTVLVYGHYDVQPADPAEWKSPPFEPEVRNGYLYGRGSVDDKGQVWMHLKAVESYLKTGHELPINIKMIVEGNEENDDLPFEQLVEQEQSRLAADAVVISDTLMFSDDVPSLTISLRGKAHIQVTVHGPNTELHSGSFGGPVGNPVTVLDSIIASLHDKDGHVTVPGFYDGIQTPAPAVVDSIRNLPFDEAKFRKESGDVPGIGGEKGYTALEQMWLRPTLEVIGQSGGFTEKGFQASIPRSAMAKIECRLVPGQDDQKVANAVAQAIKDAAPPTVTVDIDVAEGVGKALVTPTDSPGIRAAAKAMEEVFGKPVSFTGEGGSIPVVETFSRVLKLPTALVGVGIPTDGYHAPNERFSIDRFSKGIRIIGRLWQNLALELTTPERSAQKKVPPPPEPPGQHL